jgi:HNH endonuclease
MATKKKTMTQQRLKELLHYNKRTGIFTRRVCPKYSNQSPGDTAGCRTHHSGYVMVCVDGKVYTGHRLAWLYVKGEWPPRDIDHKNFKKNDNRFTNLRLASDSQGNAHRGKFKNNKSGVKNVRRSQGKWKATVCKDSVPIFLGYFNTRNEARIAVEAARERLHGEFA